LRESLADLNRSGVRVACVVQGTAKQAARFCGDQELSALCIADPAKESYRRMGFRRTSWWATPALALRRKQARAAGFSASLRGTFQKHSDILQLPGVALIGQGGKILWVRRAAHPGDLPSARELLSLVNDDPKSNQGARL
jgi:hypothetical protein